MRILIAEDSQTCRMILAGALRDNGYDVVETVDGEQALEALQKKDAPMLAILDWMMPKMDGLDVVQKVRAMGSERPPYIIMLTGRGDIDDVIVGLDAGANDYLAKPFDPRELRARVEVGRRMIELQDALIKSREKLAYQASHDPLTGILSRRAILDELGLAYLHAESKGHALCVGLCDIDHFKTVNDTYGHQTGDEVLCELTKTLAKFLGENDSLGRIGGEEFLLVTPREQDEAIVLFEDCCRHVAQTSIETRSGSLRVSISIGVAGHEGKTSVDELLAAADAALYQAKKDGRNRISCAAF